MQTDSCVDSSLSDPRVFTSANDEVETARSRVPVPAYLTDTYAWAYLNPFSVSFFDHHWIVSAILLGNYAKLEHATLETLAPGMRVLQPACVYGRFSAAVAQRLGPAGQLDVIDVAPIQVKNCRSKLEGISNASVRQANAATPGNEQYDAVACFFLLHEVPEQEKRRIVDALLSRLAPGGRLIFVDYHRPHWAHPLRALIRLVFATLEPFASALWAHEIQEYASHPDDYQWDKTCFFGGMYQKVVVTRH